MTQRYMQFIMHSPQIPVGDRLRFFSGKLEKNNRRSMGFICHRGRIQTRIHTESSSIRDKGDLSPEQKFKYFKSRSGRFIKNRCCRNSPVKREKLRFLQHLLFGSEKERKNETSNKSETPNQVSEKRTFQNGHFDQGCQSSKAKRLGNLSRSQRCISAHSNFCKAQTAPSVLHRRPVLSMEMSLLRPNNNTHGVYKGNFCSSSSLKSSKHQTSALSGRLAGFKPVIKVAFSRSRENAESFDFSRFHNQQREIRSHFQTGNSLHRGNVSFLFGNSDSNSRKNRETCYGSEQIVQRSKSGQRFSPSVRLNGFMSRIDSQCLSVHATHSATSIIFLEALVNESRDVNPCYASSKITSSMVVKSSKHFEGSIFTTGSHAYDSNHRCISTRLRGSCGQNFIQGLWSDDQQKLHINLLELEAVFLTIKHFLPILRNKNVLIRSDSTKVVQYINKQGGTRAPPLCYRTWDLWNFVIQNNIITSKQLTF